MLRTLRANLAQRLRTFIDWLEPANAAPVARARALEGPFYAFPCDLRVKQPHMAHNPFVKPKSRGVSGGRAGLSG